MTSIQQAKLGQLFTLIVVELSQVSHITVTSEEMLCLYRITALLSRFFIYFQEQHYGLIK